MNTSGTIVARYTYDAWGKLLSMTDVNGDAVTSTYHLAYVNPLRYRGYYYDSESGFYYLQSRYYDPNIGRFINADAYVSTGESFAGLNMFAYCDNNPVNRYDPTGHSWKSFWSKVGDALGTAASAVVKAVSKVFGKVYGASASVVYQETDIKTVDNGIISITKGSRTETTTSSVGNASSQYYVYAEGRSDNVFMSSVGAGYNIGQFSLNYSVGLDETGTELSYEKGATTTSVGLIGNFSTNGFGVEYAVTTAFSPVISKTQFIYVSVDLLLAASVAISCYTGLPIVGMAPKMV